MKRSRTDAAASSRSFARRLTIVAVTLVGVAGLVTLGVRSHRSSQTDPTAFGPQRFLELRSARIERGQDGGLCFVSQGVTNLPDGARIQIDVHATESVFADVAVCSSGQFSLDRRESSRIVSKGHYVVIALFVLEDQDESLRKRLHYQPGRMESRLPLEIDSGNETPSLRADWSSLIARANSATDVATVARVASDVAGFERRLWISRLRPATQQLRRALEAAQSNKVLDVANLRREIAKAEILSSF